jgi:YVTN family beta-propeller protein
MPTVARSSFLAGSLLAAFLPAQAAAQPAVVDRLLVCNKAEHTLSIFDPATRQEVAKLPTGRGPHEVAVSPDGKLAVVSDYGDQKPGQTLTVVDVPGAAVLRTIALGRDEVDADGKKTTKAFLRPHGVQFVANDRVVVTSEASRCLLLVDVTKGAIERTWTSTQGTMHMVAVTADRRRAAASSIREGSVVFFDLAGEGAAATAPIVCGEGSEGIGICPLDGHTWVGNRAANTVSVVDAKGQTVKTLTTGDFPFRIAFVPDGTKALVTCAEGGQLQVFDSKTHALLNDISIHEDRSELSAMPMGVVADADGKCVWITCGRGEFVAVIDLAKGELVHRVPARKGCDGIGWARFTGAPATPAAPAEPKR